MIIANLTEEKAKYIYEKEKLNSKDLILNNYEVCAHFAYTRTLNNEKFLIIANLTEEKAKYIYEKEKLNSKDLILNNYEVCAHENLTEFTLKPYECRVYKLS